MNDKINTYLALFQYQKPNPEGTNERQKEGFWSFTHEAINDSSEEYRAMSNIIHGSGLDEDSAYTFTVEALETMKSILIDGDVPKRESAELEALEETQEEIDKGAEAPIYIGALTSWIAKASNYSYLEDAINEYGWNNNILASMEMAYSKAWTEHYYTVLGVIKG